MVTVEFPFKCEDCGFEHGIMSIKNVQEGDDGEIMENYFCDIQSIGYIPCQNCGSIHDYEINISIGKKSSG